MLTLALVVFFGIFVVFALLIYASGAGATQKTKQTLANLKSALAADKQAIGNQAVDVRKSSQFSAVPWINRQLQGIELAPRLHSLLAQANMNWTAGQLLLLSAICFVAVAYLVALRTGGILFPVFAGLVASYIPFAYVQRKRTKRLIAFEQGLPEALDMMVSGLRAGHSLVAALRLVAYESPDPIGSEFRICFDEQNYGLELRNALENLTNRIPIQDMRIVATAIMIQKESGGNLAEVLDKASRVIRDRFRLKRQIRVHTAQGRMTGIILTLLPLVLGVLLYLISPETTRILWTNEIGIKLLYASAIMTVVGGFIIRKIVNLEV